MWLARAMAERQRKRARRRRWGSQGGFSFLLNGLNDLMTVGTEIIDDVQRLLDAGIIRKVRVKLGNRTLREIPVSPTTLGAVAIGLLAVLITRLAIEVDRD
jgi:hypothetical protein